MRERSLRHRLRRRVAVERRRRTSHTNGWLTGRPVRTHTACCRPGSRQLSVTFEQLLIGVGMPARSRRVPGSLRVLLLALCSLTAARSILAQRPTSPESQDIVRRLEVGRLPMSFKYGYEVMDAALDRSVARYGPYKIEPVVTNVSVRRLNESMATGDLVNVKLGDSGPADVHEHPEPITIEIPLDKGLHGYRVAFIRAVDQDQVRRVRDLAGLRQLRIGQGEHWPDTRIYERNAIQPITAREFESLLLMLESGRFDLFPRGATEILAEYDAYRNKHPKLAIDEHLLIHYPFVMVASVSRATPRLAERIRYGLQEMLRDGSFDRKFDRYFAEVNASLHLEQRTVIELENPFLPAWAKTPRLDWGLRRLARPSR